MTMVDAARVIKAGHLCVVEQQESPTVLAHVFEIGLKRLGLEHRRIPSKTSASVYFKFQVGKHQMVARCSHHDESPWKPAYEQSDLDLRTAGSVSKLLRILEASKRSSDPRSFAKGEWRKP